MDETLFNQLLRLGDDSLILGQRLGEWCGHAPTIEVDLSLTNISLDLIGQAQLFLGYAGEIEGKGRDADRLAFHRDALAFRNCLLVEQPNGDFGQTMARQFLFSTWQKLLFDKLAAGPEARVAEIAAKAVKEVAYHADLAADWVIRLGDGTEESHRRIEAGFGRLWRFVDELFDGEEDLRGAFDARLAEVFAQATLPLPALPRPIRGGRKGHHSEHLGHVLAVMQHLPRSYPDARW